MANGYRTLSQHLNDLKKENFSLKLRIYFLEERMQQKHEDSEEDVHRRNIELKVEVESLKWELQEKLRHLDEALTKAESLTNHNEVELQLRCEQKQQEIDRMQEILETKIQLLQDVTDAGLAYGEAGRTAALAESRSMQDPSLERMVKETMMKTQEAPSPQADSQGEMEEMKAALCDKEAQIAELTGERTFLRGTVEELEDRLRDLTALLQQKERDAQLFQDELCREKLCVQQEMQTLLEERQSQMNQYEQTAGQCVSELQKAQLQVQSLQAKIQESEASNQRLQNKLFEMEEKLQVLQQEPQLQACVIQSPSNLVQTMDVGDPEGVEPGDGTHLQGELLALRDSLFSTQLELQSHQRAREQSERRATDLASILERLQSDLNEALQYREAAELHNQELRSALHQARSAVQQKEEQLKEREAQAQMEVEARDRTVHTLRVSLQKKEQLLQENLDLLDSMQEPSMFRDTLLAKLKERIKDRDRALEHAIDDKFHCLEERDGEVQRLHMALREKDRDMERLRCVLSSNEEMITSLDGLLRAKQLELERVTEASRSLRWLMDEAEERHGRSLVQERALVSQLRASLETRSREAEELTAVLVAKLPVSHSEVLKGLQRHLQLKDRLFREILSDHDRLAQEHQAEVQQLLRTISTRDQYIQDSAARLGQVISEGQAEVQELRRQLAASEKRGLEAECLGDQLREKDAFIRQLLQNQEEPMVTSIQGETAAESCDHDFGAQRDLRALQEELQLALKKEKETQVELSALRSALAKRTEERPSKAAELDTTTQNLHLEETLSKFFSEYNTLNKALKMEREIYHSLIQTQENGPKKTQALHEELEAIQALRGQLERVLVRTQDTALALEKAAKMQPDFGELSTEEEQEEDGRSEFADSIEEVDDFTLTAQTLSITQNVILTREPVDWCGGPISGVISQDSTMEGQGLAGWRYEMEQLVEQKKTMELELGELKAQLEKSGFSSLSQMRAALQGLRQENEESKVPEWWRGAEKRTQDRLSEDEHGIREEEEGDEDETSSTRQPCGPAQGKRCAPGVQLRRGKRKCTRPRSLDLDPLLAEGAADSPTQGARPSATEGGFWQHVEAGLREQAQRLRMDLALSRQETRELQERLMVSEATVQAQAEQLKDYRELLTETSVEQHSKQVQVDLQDLGYETSCRSENEAEREDASSPEFDDLEMCPDLPRQDHGAEWWAGDCGKCEEAAELRNQLSHAHRTIRRLHARMRSLSATSDYASSLERPRRKMGWAFRASSALGGPDEDEGWQSDGPAPFKLGHGEELQDLVARVAVLETQLKNKDIVEDVKSATWPGKYGTLIQAQARELSHLRQRMREGHGICHALAQHLDDTTKAFEELLRANDVDYYMGQSLRQQLTQSQALASRLGVKLNGRDDPDLHVDKMGPKQLALQLRKELQQKDEIIESLHTELHRADTPSSCHAPSESTDRSDGTSFMSSERGFTNEDPELGLDVDGASECGRDERAVPSSPGTTQAESAPSGGSTTWHPSIPSSTSPSHKAQSASSCPSMPCPPYLPVENQAKGVYCSPISSFLPIPPSQYCPNLQGQSGTFPFTPQSPLQGVGLLSLTDAHQELQRQLCENSLSGFPPAPHSHLDPSGYMPLSHSTFHPSQFGVPEGSRALSTFVNLSESSASWDNGCMRAGGCASLSSGSGSLLTQEHLREVRDLRRRLEDSIHANERLRRHLEEGLAPIGRDGTPTDIYIQGLESLTSLANENRALKEENLALQARLQTSRDGCQEAERLRALLKEAELEVEHWKEELQRLQAHSCDQALEIQRLHTERQGSQQDIKRLQQEVNLLQQQLSETQQLLESLRRELELYKRVWRPSTAHRGQARPPMVPAAEDLTELLAEVCRLRAQLESSYRKNSALRTQLLQQQSVSPKAHGEPGLVSGRRDSSYGKHFSHDLAPSPPVRDTGLCDTVPPASAYTETESPELTSSALQEPPSLLEGDAADGSFACESGRHAVGHLGDFSALRQQVLEGKVLVQEMEATLQCCLECALLGPVAAQTAEHGRLRTLLGDARTLWQILDEADSLLKMFWRAALPSSEDCTQQLKKEQSMRREIQQLRRKIHDQEEALQGTVERLRSSNRSKESMEHFIVSQLSRTRDVLKKARTNLEKNEYKLSTLSSSSSSPGPGKAEGRHSGCGWVRPHPLQGADLTASRKRSGQCLLQVVAY